MTRTARRPIVIVPTRALELAVGAAIFALGFLLGFALDHLTAWTGGRP